jgi:hypothetical protein
MKLYYPFLAVLSRNLFSRLILEQVSLGIVLTVQYTASELFFTHTWSTLQPVPFIA